MELYNFSEAIRNTDWVEYVNIPVNKDDEFVWWRLNNFNPEEILKNVKCRTLCLFGEYDPSVPPEENVNKMRDYLSSSGVEFNINFNLSFI